MSDIKPEEVNSKELHFTEIRIPVPWGHIAGKTCGKSTGQQVLAVHGIQDNCGVFDRLLSLLENNYYVVAIDLPGHGYSSHFPAGLPLSFLNYVLAVAYVVKELKWQQLLYLGHSFGGQIGAFYSAMFPHLIRKLLVIDHIAPQHFHGDELVQSLSRWINSYIKLESRLKTGKTPVYTYDEAVRKMTDRDSVLTTEAAQIVLKRSLKQVPGGYTFCMDQRLKLTLFPTLTTDLIKDVYRNIRCPMLLLISSARFKLYREIFSEVFEVINEKTNMRYIVVPGNHDLHQNNPESVTKFIDEFFSNERCKI